MIEAPASTQATPSAIISAVDCDGAPIRKGVIAASMMSGAAELAVMG
jgi:hypothetical protein